MGSGAYAERTGATCDDLESVLADLTADLHHLADRLGLDRHEVTRRAEGYDGEKAGSAGAGSAAGRGPVVPALEVIVVRDPDGPSGIEVFAGGVAVLSTGYVLDAGAGWQWDDWTEARDANLAAASPAARAALLGHYADPPGGKYVDGHGDAPWLDPVPVAADRFVADTADVLGGDRR